MLIFSIVLPFTLSDALSAQNTLMHNVITHIGFTETFRDREARAYDLLVICLIENMPQFLTVVYEMIKYRKTINFVQASNPLYSVMMIYRAVGPFIGRGVYFEFGPTSAEDGTPAMKVFLAIVMLIVLTPQYYIGYMIRTHYISQDLIPQVYLDNNLFEKEEPSIIGWGQNTMIQTLLVLLAIPIGVAVGKYYMRND